MKSMSKVIKKKKNHISTLQKVTNFIFQKKTFYISLEIIFFFLTLTTPNLTTSYIKKKKKN